MDYAFLLKPNNFQVATVRLRKKWHEQSKIKQDWEL
jgi:hypothetical protein